MLYFAEKKDMDLKSNKFSFFALAILMSAAALLGSCGSRNASSTEASDSVNDTIAAEDSVEVVEVVFDTVIYSDSVIFGNKGSVHVDWNVVFPATSEVVYADSIRDWVLRFVGDTSSVAKDAQLADIIVKKGKDELESCKEEVEGLIQEDEEYEVESWNTWDYESTLDITVLYENEEYITMEVSTYLYAGGAHAFSTYYGVTFRKSDGHIMGWDLLSDMSTKEITSKISDGLVEYFEVKSVDDLYGECLFDYIEEGDLPMPGTAPYLVEEGVAFIYQSYEIAPYVAGMPEGVIKIEE